MHQLILPSFLQKENQDLEQKARMVHNRIKRRLSGLRRDHRHTQAGIPKDSTTRRRRKKERRKKKEEGETTYECSRKRRKKELGE